MLRACIQSVFSRLPEEYTLSYLDEDGDRISLMSDYDLAALLESGRKQVKLFINNGTGIQDSSKLKNL